MSTIEIRWPALGLGVRVELHFTRNPTLARMLLDHPHRSIQTHALVSGDHLYHVAPIPELIHAPAQFKVADRTKCPDGTVFMSSLQHVGVKCGPLSEYLPAAPVGQVVEEDVETLKRAAAECWRSVTETKQPIEVHVCRTGEEAPLGFPDARALTNPSASQLLADILGEARAAWLDPPREVVDVHQGRIRSGAGSRGQWHSTLVFLNSEVRQLGYSGFGGYVRLSQDPDVPLDVLKTMLASGEYVKTPAEFLGYVGLDTLWSLTQRAVRAAPELGSKDDVCAIMGALATYANQLNAWCLHFFPWSQDPRYARSAAQGA